MNEIYDSNKKHKVQQRVHRDRERGDTMTPIFVETQHLTRHRCEEGNVFNQVLSRHS